MRTFIIIIIALFSVSYSQEFDYSKMSNTEKILMYNSLKKSPVAAGFLELIPTAGYAYTGNWKRGLVIRVGIPLAAGSLTGFGLTALSAHVSGIEDSLKGTVMFSLIYLIPTTLFAFYDAPKQASQHNNRIHKQIFGKESPKIGVNLYPIHDGAGITFTYSFN